MIVLTGISHHTAGIEIREQLALTEDEAKALAARLAIHDHVAEVFVVSTCNRVEVICSSRDESEASAVACQEACREAFVERCAEAAGAIYSHKGSDAVRHLVRVAASLDSLVIGEAQILGQLRQGFESARQASTVGATLHQLFSCAARGAKKIRTETSIGEGQVSVPSIAIELTLQIFGDLKGRRAALIGSGEMGQTVARLLREAGAELTVLGRTLERVSAVTSRVGGTARLMDALPEVLATVDVVVSSTSATHHVISPQHLELRKKSRRRGNLFFVDLAVPRDVDPVIGKLDGMFLYDVDDLARVATQSAGGRLKAAAMAEEIVDRVVFDWERRESVQLVVPTIKALRAKMRRGLEEELSRSLKGRLKDLGVDQRVALAKMLDAGLSRILHDPITRLRDEAAREGGLSADQLANTLSELFDLAEVPEHELDVPSIRYPSLRPESPYISHSTAPGADELTQPE